MILYIYYKINFFYVFRYLLHNNKQILNLKYFIYLN